MPNTHNYTALIPQTCAAIGNCLPEQAKQTEEATATPLLLPGGRHWGLRGLRSAAGSRRAPGLGRLSRCRCRCRGRGRGTAATAATTATASTAKSLTTHTKDVGLQVCLCLLGSSCSLGGVRLRNSNSRRQQQQFHTDS
jgi:hypothetical protein